MTPDLALKLAKLRTYVAFLGEKDQQNWWPSSFLSRSGAAFLNPVFPKTSLLARVTGASNAAQVAHDEHIGVGDVFHLFRLPENMEHDIFQVLTNELSILEIGSEDDAYTSLQGLTNGDTTQGIGPLLLNQSEIDQATISHMAAAYLAGFKNNQTVYPYYKG
jgi:hypothetical protein